MQTTLDVKAPTASPEDGPVWEESPAWEQIHGTWHPVHGNIHKQGYSLEWHDFRVHEPLDWARSFHQGSVEICLNFAGRARLGRDGAAGELADEQMAVYIAGDDTPRAEREADVMHRFFTLELSVEFLRRHLESQAEDLLPEVRQFIMDPGMTPAVALIRRLPTALLGMRMHLLNPPVFPAARETWYQSKVLEIVSQALFTEKYAVEGQDDNHKSTTRERVERVCYLLERDLENPPSLPMLAEEVGCSAFYLSRLFAQETGSSIPKYLRTKRLEKAGEYLRGGKMNVTEAAMSVGYSSLSSFNKAFVEYFGCCPGLYPAIRRSGKVK